MSDDRIIDGLPAELPAGERLLWQGSPDWRALTLQALHVRKLAIYFGVLLAWYVLASLPHAEAPAAVLMTAAKLAAVALVPLALLTLYGYLAGRTTIYSITDRRVVMRFSVALPLTLNIPFSKIEAANARLAAGDSGDIALSVADGPGLGYIILWPHVRPWHMMRARPSLRCIPDAARVAQMLSRALAASAEVAVPAATDLRPTGAAVGTRATAAA